jgi:hypothetical protein
VGVEPPHGLSPRAKAAAGAFVGVLYIIGGTLYGGDVVPTVIGGILAGVLTFLVLREIEDRRRRRWRRQQQER